MDRVGFEPTTSEQCQLSIEKKLVQIPRQSQHIIALDKELFGFINDIKKGRSIASSSSVTAQICFAQL
jgi:hypothetical protein